MEDTTKASTPSAGDTTFTPNETKLICAIMQNLTSEIQVSQTLKNPAHNRPQSHSTSETNDQTHF